ncbi:TRAP transporter large permease subunit, partial [Vibrio parahaemolyticus]|nr:TRAP transporter large permease subunit [Vibrio parahaemolyticus]
MAVCLAVAIHFSVRSVDTLPRATGSQRWRSAVAAIPAFGLGVIVVVGIRIGVVTTTEAAALAALYTLFLGFGYRLGARRIFYNLPPIGG